MTSDEELIARIREALSSALGWDEIDEAPIEAAQQALDTLARRLEAKGRQTKLLLQVELERDETLTRLRELEDGLRNISGIAEQFDADADLRSIADIAHQLLSPSERTMK